MIQLEEIVSDEWAAWYRLSPVERWHESEQLWQFYLQFGGSLDTEPDTQSPFYDPHEPSASPSDGWSGVRVLRRSRV